MYNASQGRILVKMLGEVISDFATRYIITKFLWKHDIKRALDTEMDDYHFFNFNKV
jgi:hypothetical protein